MKYSVLLFTLIVFSISSLDGICQTKNRYNRSGSKFDIKFGIKAGVVSSKFSGDEFLVEYDVDNILIYPEVSYSSLLGYHGGAYMDIRLDELLVIQPEVQFTMMGTKMTRKVDLGNPEQNYTVTAGSRPEDIEDIILQRRLNYLHVPLIVKIGLSRLTHLNVGPQFGFILSEADVYEEINPAALSVVSIADPQAPSPFKGTDYGVILGLSQQLQNGLVFNLRYNRNFKNIQKNEGLTLLAEEPKNRNTAILFSVGYTFLYRDRLKINPGRQH